MRVTVKILSNTVYSFADEICSNDDQDENSQTERDTNMCEGTYFYYTNYTNVECFLYFTFYS